jgi:hypothetical protein
MAFITGAKCQIFQDPNALTKFITTNVTTVIAIVFNNSGNYVLFYT